MKQNENIWISAEDLSGDETLVRESKSEFFNLPILNDLADEKVVSEHSANTNRRDFLKYLGFSLGAATVAAACDTPIRKAIPYVNKPEAIVPGVATYYASSFVRGGDYCPILVKTREGRPIKIEGNTMARHGGGTTARAQASVLDLYDVARLRAPQMKDSVGMTSATTWSAMDAAVSKGLKAAKGIRLVANTNISPCFKATVEKFMAMYPNAKLITYDAVSSSAALLASEAAFGVRELPGYRFDQASLIVNFGADFLGTWLTPSEFAAQFSSRRKMKGADAANMSRLVQFESNMSYTGSNADHRVLIKPSEQGLAIAKLHNAIAKKVGQPTIAINGNLSNPKAEKAINTVADELMQARGKSIVLSGSNNTAEQSLIVAINQALENFGKTVSYDTASHLRQGIDKEMASFISDLSSGAVDAVIFIEDANPVYDHPLGAKVAEALDKASLSVAVTGMPSETQALCGYTAPTPHYLESWGDVNPSRGHFGIVQPTINPLFDTRPVVLSLMAWIGETPETMDGDDPMYTVVKKFWEENLFPKQTKYATFRSFWDNTLHDGFCEIEEGSRELVYNLDVSTLSGKINRLANSELEVQFYEPMGVGGGAYSNNPWLQEMPDPVTRVVWDNVLHIPLKWNGRDKFEYYKDLDEDGLLVDLTVGEQKIQVPVVRQFGQMEGTVACALGYGRWATGKAGNDVGSNCYPMLKTDGDGNIQYFSVEPMVSGKQGKDKRFASVQHHHTLGVTGKDESEGGATINVDEKVVMTIGTGYQGSLTKRSIFRHANAVDLEEAVADLKEERAEFQHLNQQTLYPDRSEFYGMGHHWGISVDLSACIGCGSCQVACVAENNVPIVGKTEVNRHHEMTWMRIDRYYYGDVETPSVVYQPMMCQHCDNAPCENVCPVAATNHSSEGLNQMAYNRCVGTRYCANNCPYKVRRFNWFLYNKNNEFDFHMNDDLGRMVLNPDVNVRSRGVMEKCSMCIQMTQATILKAKKEGRPVNKDEFQTACSSACSTGSMVFGDVNDKESEVAKLVEDDRMYHLLEHVGTKPNVFYHVKVRNT
ncbi:MAG: TAT-variant-translocated molybdopterin oxidoreductase [Saprospiraceae bacterium]|nr:TAT-variant-translocated molybdopterin oxidoreductase [Saprospiraceae bacterium]